MLVNQSDLMRNLLLKAPSEDSWNQTTKPCVMPNWGMDGPGRDRGFMPMPRIGIHPTFPFPGHMVQPDHGYDMRLDPRADQQSAIVRLINVLLNMAQNLINRLENFTGMNQSNNQLNGVEGGPAITDQLFNPMDPNMIDPGFDMNNPNLVDTYLRRPTPVTPKAKDDLGSRLGNLFDGLKGGWSSLKEILTSGKDLWKTVREGWTSFKDFAKPLLGGLGSMVSSPLRGIGNLFSSGFNVIKNLF
jgi:hypothetical protein